MMLSASQPSPAIKIFKMPSMARPNDYSLHLRGKVQSPVKFQQMPNYDLAGGGAEGGVGWYQIRIWAGSSQSALPCLALHNENVNVRIGDYLSIFSLD